MPVINRKWPMLDYVVGSAPEDAGVYGLWHGEELVFLGSTTSALDLRQCLLEHFHGKHGPLTQQADHFSWELAKDPHKRLEEVLTEYCARNRHLPKGNRGGESG